MVTRPADQAHSLASSLRDLGADVVIEPVIEIQPPLDWTELDRAIQNVAEGRVSTLAFVSVNGVRVFLDRFAQLAQATKADPTPKLEGVRVIGIGKATCEALSARGVEALTVPGKSDSNSVADFLIDPANQAAAGTILIVRADRGSDVLPNRLKESQIEFQQVVAYRSVDRETVPTESILAMKAGKIDWVTVTSSAIAGSLVRLFEDALVQTKLASISPTTSAALRDLGYSPAAEATDYNMPGVVQAIIATHERT